MKNPILMPLATIWLMAVQGCTEHEVLPASKPDLDPNPNSNSYQNFDYIPSNIEGIGDSESDDYYYGDYSPDLSAEWARHLLDMGLAQDASCIETFPSDTALVTLIDKSQILIYFDLGRYYSFPLSPTSELTAANFVDRVFTRYNHMQDVGDCLFQTELQCFDTAYSRERAAFPPLELD